MLGISQLNEILDTDELPTPGEILTQLRTRVVRELGGADKENTTKDGMDAALVKIPIPNSGSLKEENEVFEVEFAGAQNPLYVIREGIAEEPPSASMKYRGESLEGNPVKPFRKSSDGIEIKGDPMPVGYEEHAKDAFTTVNLQVRKGDMLYIFSDGFADQFGGPKGKKFRYGPFKELLAELHEKPLEGQKQELDKTFKDWKAGSGQEQIDDVVVIGVRL
ncbi:MAG: PP2C family protein-serine/threonine phosphatase [Flavobacteriales bacterium]